MTSSIAPSPVNFHISLNSSDIDRSVKFFKNVFGCEPAKHRPDYAKFELQNPPITFSLEPMPPSEHGTLNHVGFRLNSSEELVELQKRLNMAGLSSQREEGVECCYAKQTKFWLHDPEGTLWEMYVLEGDLEHRGAGQDEAAVRGPEVSQIRCSATPETGETKQAWSHRLGSEMVIPEEISPESLDEVSLQGSFNAAGTLEHITSFLVKIEETLKPGGSLSIHCLTSDRPVSESPNLPGPASVVKSIPELKQLIGGLEQAGFEAIELTTFRPQACFTHEDAELRETKIHAVKPIPLQKETLSVVYQGPFAEIVLDGGIRLHRGHLTEISQSQLESSFPAADRQSIVVLERATEPVSCSGS